MMTDITEDLPRRIREKGGKLFMKNDGSMIKYLLECKKLNYRSFIYVRAGYREADASLKDLYNDFYYANNIGVIANRERT